MAKKEEKELTELQKLMKGETRQLDDLPGWKRREIERLRENEERLAEEQNEKDFKNQQGIYHPEAIALAQSQAAAKAKAQQGTGANMAALIDEYEMAKYYPEMLGAPNPDSFKGSPLPKEDISPSNFWETEEFQMVVQQIQTGMEDGMKVLSSPAVRALKRTPGEQVEIPTTDLFAGGKAGASGGSRDKTFISYEDMLEGKKQAARASLMSTTQQLLGSTGPKKTITPPAYLMTLYGPEGPGTAPMPFFQGELSTYESVKEATKEHPNWLVREGLPMLLSGFKIGSVEVGLGGLIDAMYQGVDANVGGRVIKGLTLGGMSEEEWVYQENPNGPQATVQALFSLGVLGYESLRYFFTAGPGTHEYKSNDPEIQARHAEEARRLGEAVDAFTRAWETGEQAWAEAEVRPENNPYLSPEERTQARMDHDLRVAVQEKAAQIRSEELAAAASETWVRAVENFDPGPDQEAVFKTAIVLQMQAIEERRKTDPMDAWGAATWQREPEKYKMFLENAAALELQLGRPLTVVEIRRLKDMYSNVYTELAFQLVFDLTNIIPAISQVTQVSSAFPILGRMKTAVTSGVSKVGDYVPIVRWMKAPAVSAVATQIADNVDNLTRKMMPAYRSVAEITSALKKMEPLIEDFKLARNLDAQQVVFEKARQTIPGVAEWDFDDFRRFADAHAKIPTGSKLSLAEEYATAQRQVEQAVFDSLKKRYPTWNQQRLENRVLKTVHSPQYVEMTTRMFGTRVAEVFSDSHRLFENSSIYDDTLIGNFVKNFALLTSNVPSAAQRKLKSSVIMTAERAMQETTLRRLIVTALESSALKGRTTTKIANYFRDMRTFDMWLMDVGVGFTGSGTEWARMALVDGLEHALRMGNILKRFWMGIVLTTPRFIITNLIDSAGRAFIYGENIFDDIATLIMSTQRHFPDGYPIQIPREMTTSLARTEIEMLDEVSIRLMYEHPDDLPGMNPFSFLKREHGRRYAKAREARATPLMAGVTEEFKNRYIRKVGNQLANPLLNAWDWLKSIPGSMVGASADFNTSIEFTLRSRMFYRSYMSNIMDLEGRAIRALIDDVEDYSPFMKDLMTRIYREAEGSPSKMKGLVESLTMVSNKGTRDMNQLYSWILPSDWMKNSNMDPTRLQLFTHTVRENTEKFMDDIFKRTGGLPTPEQWDEFFTKFQTNMENSYQEVMATRGKEFKHAGMDDSIDPKKSVQKPANHRDLKGTNPQNLEAVTDALELIRKKGGRGKFDSAKIQESYKTIMSDFAEFAEVAGDKATVTISKGKPKLTIGNEFWNQPREQLYVGLRDATLDVVAIRNAEFLDSANLSKNQFKATALEFMDDAAAVLAKDERAFVMMMEEMDTNPILRELLAATNKAGMDNYEGAKSIYYRTLDSLYSVELNGTDSKDIKALLRKRADEILAPRIERRKAAVEEAAAAVRIVGFAQRSGDINFSGKVDALLDLRMRTRAEVQEFGRLVFPGPAMERAGDSRSSRWDLWETFVAKAYEVETSMFRELEYNIQQLGYQGGIQYMDEIMANFNEEYLRRMGIEIIWKDDTKTDIFQIKNRFEGTFITWSEGSNAFDHIKQNFFGSKLTESKTMDLVTSNSLVTTKNQVIGKIRASTGITYNQAAAWTSMMQAHAKRWMDITGGTLEEYFERFSVQQVGDVAPYLARTEAGDFRFITDASGDLPTFLRQTAEVLFEDMKELAKYDDSIAQELETIIKTLEDSTLRKSILLKYIDMDETQRVNMRQFMLEKLGDQKFNEIWNGLSTLLEGQKMGPELLNSLDKFQLKYGLDEEDMLRMLNSSYPTVSKADIKRYVETLNINRTMDAAEYNAIFSELFLEYIQTGWAPPGMPKSLNRFKEWLATDFEVLSRMNFELTDDVDRALSSIFMEQATAPTNTEEMMDLLKEVARKVGVDPDEIIAEARAARKNARAAKAKTTAQGTQPAATAPTQTAPTVRPVPDNFAEFTAEDLERLYQERMGVRAAPGDAISDEINTVWSLLVQSRPALQQYPVEALTSPWAFRKYAKEMADSMPPAAAEAYLRNIADVDNLIRKILNLPDKFPQVAEFQVNNGVRTFLKASQQINGDFEEMKRALNSLKLHLKSGGVQIPTLDDASKQQLLSWLPEAMDTKAKTVNVATYGGEFAGRGYNGAIKRVNDIMLDYTDQSRLDTLIKSVFPFWMFPSRSIPFWIKTAATHPQLIAFYNKMKRYSEASRMQAGAVTSDGRPLDSLDGYMPIPGTDIWVNPMAPLSFRYVLGLPEVAEEMIRSAGYGSRPEEELDPLSWSVKKVMEIGPMLGFNMAPWTSATLKYTLGLPDSVLPKFPVAPWISLIPRWYVFDIIQKADSIAFGGFKFGQFLYPEADFQEANVERRMYQNALERMSEPGANKAAIVEEVRTAVLERHGNALWDETYRELTNQQAFQSAASFFTGFYPKPFSDAQAELYALRNELNLLKSTMNNEFQASIFKLDGDAQARWNRYLKSQDLDEVALYRLYVQSGWVRDEAGHLVSDPVKRAAYLKEAILAEQEQQAYYAGLQTARDALDRRLAGLPIGSSYEVTAKVYEQYYAQINELRSNTNFTYDRSFGTWKPVDLIKSELRDEFYYVLLSTRPRWSENVPYDEQQRRLAAWEQSLPYMASELMKSFSTRSDIAAIISSLKEDQKLDTKFWMDLNKESQTIEGIKRWQLEKDDIFDALNNAWSELYWRPYWENSQGMSSMERELYDEDFAQNNPPPTAEQLYSWIRETYGTRFTIDEVRKWVNGTEVLDIESRLMQQRSKEQQLRAQIWDYMAWLGPNKDQEMIDYLEKAIRDAVGDDSIIKGDILSDMMERNNHLFRGDTQSLNRLVELIEKVYAEKGVKEPTRDQLVQYVKAQDSHEQFKALINKEFAYLSPDYATTGITPHDIIQDIQSDYFAVENSKSYSRKFKMENPEEYEILREYWNRKRQYGRTDKVWNMYFNMSEDRQNIPAQFTGIFGLPPEAGKTLTYPGTLPNTSGNLFRTPTYGGSAPARTAPEPKEMSSGKASLPIPTVKSTSLEKALGPLLTWEVNSMYKSGRPLTPAAVDFLQRLLSRHPEWRQEIGDILRTNKPPLKSTKSSNILLR